MIVVLAQKGHFESRQGLLYGPFTPVYGIGAIVYYIIFTQIKTRNKVKVFFIAMILGGCTEYLCSLIQEKVFSTISWDYSYLPFDINGRTSLLHCTYWGIAGVLYITFIEPFIGRIKDIMKNNVAKVVTPLIVVFMIFNITISWTAAERQKERRNNILPENKMEQLLDKYYPDEYMDRVFANKMNK